MPINALVADLKRRDRRQQVQGGERPRPQLHACKMARRMAQIEESIGRYLRRLDSADRQEPSEAISIKTTSIKEKIARLKQEMSRTGSA